MLFLVLVTLPYAATAGATAAVNAARAADPARLDAISHARA
jgi:hypothetical protein